MKYNNASFELRVHTCSEFTCWQEAPVCISPPDWLLPKGAFLVVKDEFGLPAPDASQHKAEAITPLVGTEAWMRHGLDPRLSGSHGSYTREDCVKRRGSQVKDKWRRMLGVMGRAMKDPSVRRAMKESLKSVGRAGLVALTPEIGPLAAGIGNAVIEGMGPYVVRAGGKRYSQDSGVLVKRAPPKVKPRARKVRTSGKEAQYDMDFTEVVGDVYATSTFALTAVELSPCYATLPCAANAAGNFAEWQFAMCVATLVPTLNIYATTVKGGTWGAATMPDATATSYTSKSQMEGGNCQKRMLTEGVVIGIECDPKKRVKDWLFVQQFDQDVSTENTHAKLMVFVDPADSSLNGVKIGELHIRYLIRFRKQKFNPERFGMYTYHGNGASGSDPFGTQINSLGVGMLRGSSVSSGQVLTLANALAGDNFQVIVTWMGTSATCTYTVSDLAIANGTTYTHLINGSGNAIYGIFAPLTGVASLIAVMQVCITATASGLALSFPTTWTLPTSSYVNVVVSNIGFGVSSTSFRTTSLSARNMVLPPPSSWGMLDDEKPTYVDEQNASIIEHIKGMRKLQIDVNPPNPDFHPLPPPEVRLVLEDEDLETGIPADVLDQVSVEDLEAILVRRRAGGGSGYVNNK